MLWRLLSRTTWALGLGILVGLSSAAHAAPPGQRSYGKLSGVVFDFSGTPQMGATVQLIAESAGATPAAEFLTNPFGAFSGEKLLPGFYTVRATLAGYLPTIQRHVRINSHLTTLLRIELDSMFSSLDRLRRQPVPTTEPDDWKWVLRTAADMRPVLQWMDHDRLAASLGGESRGSRAPHARLELTTGAHRPGSVSNLADAAGTAFAYDQRVGNVSHLLLAGQASYERSAAAGIATVWQPAGSLPGGPQTTVALRQSQLGHAGPTFRGLRVDQSGTLELGGRRALHYGAEYVLVTLGGAASSIRPRAQLDLPFAGNWRAALIFAAQPGAPVTADADDGERAEALRAALNQLDAFPVVLWRSGRPVLASGWHQEISAEHRLGQRGSLHLAGFHDDSRHTAIFGRHGARGGDFLRDSFFSDAFAYDGGSSSAWGARVAVREKLANDVEIFAIYTYAGALAPEESLLPGELRDSLRTRYLHSLAGRVRARVPKVGTRVTAGYNWIQGPVASKLDTYGESQFDTDPYLHLSVRQHLPRVFALGRWEALADFQNLLAQGYVPVNGRDGRLVLVPAFRSFRGGLSFQF